MGSVDNPTIRIREAVPGQDEPVIQALRASVGWSTVETGLASMLAGRSIVYILEVDGVAAASGSLILMSDDHDLADGSTTALVSTLIVNSDYQSHGLGTRLLEFLEAEAKARGFRTITIGVDVPNTRARSLYERHGYAAFKDKRELWGPVTYLRKPLA